MPNPSVKDALSPSPAGLALLLAQSSATSQKIQDLWLWLGVTAALILAAGVFAHVVLKKMRHEDPPSHRDVTGGLDVSSLRQMHAQGLISDEELARTRAVINARMRAQHFLDNQPATPAHNEKNTPPDPLNPLQ
ncbi:MAG: hypothetical protein IT443_10755 [Phycisphaeraceae bacterium]|nr:hypothetical protein [Phycisphaeraceae bacterium]